jgi:hypothetical protein
MMGYKEKIRFPVLMWENLFEQRFKKTEGSIKNRLADKFGLIEMLCQPKSKK